LLDGRQRAPVRRGGRIRRHDGRDKARGDALDTLGLVRLERVGGFELEVGVRRFRAGAASRQAEAPPPALPDEVSLDVDFGRGAGREDPVPAFTGSAAEALFPFDSLT
jgi:hypothetical protein